jgi:cell division protein FtsB
MASAKKLLIGLGITTAVLALYGPGTVRWLELQARKAQLEEENRALALENRRLSEEVRRLREDASYAEAVARRQLGLVRPGETKLTFRRSDSAGP